MVGLGALVPAWSGEAGTKPPGHLTVFVQETQAFSDASRKRNIAEANEHRVRALAAFDQLTPDESKRMDTVLRYQAAGMLRNAERYEDAHTQLSGVVDTPTGRRKNMILAVVALFDRGEVTQFYRDRPREAAADYEAALAACDAIPDAQQKIRDDLKAAILGSLFCLAVNYDMGIDVKEARRLVDAAAAIASENDSRLPYHLAMVLAMEGDAKSARESITRVRADELDPHPPESSMWTAAVLGAYVFAYLGDAGRDEAFDYLERGLAAHRATATSDQGLIHYLTWLRDRHALRSLKADPRFDAVFAKYTPVLPE